MWFHKGTAAFTPRSIMSSVVHCPRSRHLEAIIWFSTEIQRPALNIIDLELNV